MNQRGQPSFPSVNRATYACVIGALIFVLVMGCWGLYRELRQNHATILTAMVSRLRAQAARRVGHIESGLERIAPLDNLADVRDDSWLRQYWAGVVPLQEHQLYSAIVNEDGTVVFHSDPSLESQQLRRRWYDHVVDGTGADVVESRNNFLASGQPTYSVQIPLMVNGRLVGEYHEGLSAEWVDEQVRANRVLILRRWSIVIGAILVVIVVAIGLLYLTAQRSLGLRQAIALAHTQRITELGQLAAGLAHEIRNPLHAIRLNLHTLRRAQFGGSELEPGDVDKLTRQSQEEIDRIDQLMRELLGYASPEQARNEDIDVRAEIQATLQFLSKELEQSDIEVDTQLPDQPAVVRIDKTRFRQILLNILLNAKDVMPDGGTIHLALRQSPGYTEIEVDDEGPGVPPPDRERIFEPFYTTKPGGTGFGLAIARRFITDAGGTIACTANGKQGTTFRLKLPSISPKNAVGGTT